MDDYDLWFEAEMVIEGVDYSDPFDPAHQGDTGLFTRFGITPDEQIEPGGDARKRAEYGLQPGFGIEAAKRYYKGEHWDKVVALAPRDVHDVVIWCLCDVSVHSGHTTARRYAQSYRRSMCRIGEQAKAIKWWEAFRYRRILRYTKITRKRLGEAEDQEETEARWTHHRGWMDRLHKLAQPMFLDGPLTPHVLDAAQLDDTLVGAVEEMQPSRPAPLPDIEILAPAVALPPVTKQSKWMRWAKIAGTAAAAAGVSAAAPALAVLDQVQPMVAAVVDGASIKDVVLGAIAGLFVFDRGSKKSRG